MKFAVFTDLHYDVIHDGDRRLHEFINSVKEENIDFIIELGDLCHPTDANKHLISELKEVGVPCFFTVGNHNTDAYLIDAMLKFCEMDYNLYEEHHIHGENMAKEILESMNYPGTGIIDERIGE